MADVDCLPLALAPKLDELGVADANAERWTAFISANPRAWKLYLGIFLRLPATPSELAEEAPDDSDEWMCGSCSRVFASAVALKSHRLKMHGDRGELRLRYAGGVCPHCTSDHRTRHRLLRHLRVGAKVCVQAAANSQLPLLTAQQLRAADADDAATRRAARLKGVHAEWGLPATRRSPQRTTAARLEPM